MGVFIYSPTNSRAIKIREMINAPGFFFESRGHQDLILMRHLADIGIDVWPNFFTTLGSLAGSLDKHLALNPDDAIERQAMKMCDAQKSWSYVKIQNGPKMNFVIGYSDCSAASPFAYSTTQMAQKGMIRTTHIPE